MARSDLGSSGVAFTLDPITGFRGSVLVNGSFSLGENIVGGHNSALDAWDDFTIAGNVLKFRTSTSIVERMRIDSSGNVGIGTSSPDYKLDLRSGELAVRSGSSGNGGLAKLGN